MRSQENSRSPIGREPHGDGAPIVVRGRNKPATWRRGAGNPMTAVAAVREMRNAETTLAIIRKRGRQNKHLENLYRQLYKKELFLRAYSRVQKNAGALTKGITEETADGMSLQKIDQIIEKLRFERYRWNPARRA